MTNTAKLIAYWRKSAERDWQTAKGLLKLKRYDSCLFFCHLALEKMLKGLVMVKQQKPAPYLYDLEKLVNLAGVSVSTKQMGQLRIISSFNIAGRYDDVKLAFYKKCTLIFTKYYFTETGKLLVWLKKFYPKK